MMRGHKSLKIVEFYSKNNLEKLVHLVGFITVVYHDARSSERQISKNSVQFISFNCLVPCHRHDIVDSNV